MKKIVMFGICGRVGTTITKELLKADGIEITGGFDKCKVGEDIGEMLGLSPTGSKIYSKYEDIKRLNPDLIVDFTSADIAYKTINWALDNKIDIIVGTTGLKKDLITGIEEKARKGKSKIFIVPNFSIGAVVMIKISSMVSKYFDNCEIIELHHDKKKDAPSGTSILTSEKIAETRNFNYSRMQDGEEETIDGSRGAFNGGIHIHSIRLPGLLAHQEVIFGTTGQTLSLRHDSIDRLSFYPGVKLAIDKIDQLSNFTYGLDKIIEL
jgi:4-hydroxy-tetrahydrodipicolinate reductase